MSSVTPRATPVVQPPPPNSPHREPPLMKQLRAPIVVVAAGGEWEHECGELVIGRDSDATIVLEDPLVSRFHARLTVNDAGEVTLEDLHSANGVFVNGSKLSRPSMVLGEGDRLLIGTTEVSVFSLRASAMVRLGRDVAQHTAPHTLVPQHQRDAGTAATGVKMPPKRTVKITGRSDAINLVGQFADQLMESGHQFEATRVLTEHLQNLLKGASAGLTVPTRILETATSYALRLHKWTQRAAWIEYVLELHLACQQVPSDASIAELTTVWGKSPEMDRSMLMYFVRTIQRRVAPPTEDENLRLLRIERLGK